MTDQLVFVHGRSQQGKDPGALKAQWLGALNRGLRSIGSDRTVHDCDVRFPFYGDTLARMAKGTPAESAGQVIQRGAPDSDLEKAFIRQVFDEVQARAGITDEQVADDADADVIQRGPLNWAWTLAIMRAVDRRLPGGSARSILLAARDVYSYLTNSAIRERLETGVADAISAGGRSIVVAHSLGTVVTYNLLRREDQLRDGQVPLLLTLGSPLSVTAIRKAVISFAPLRCPASTAAWVNARDERDFVALYPLSPEHFPLSRPEPAITNYNGVRNQTSNRHGIEGYLDDPFVARTIQQALRS